eukprot:15445330-Alexandrium_andersonii.AAC.1
MLLNADAVGTPPARRAVLGGLALAQGLLPLLALDLGRVVAPLVVRGPCRLGLAAQGRAAWGWRCPAGGGCCGGRSG